ncbi:envelope glycoprotein I [Equid alphaherpesvirus 8]|uniref:Envelope glycoprotein I n=1 Tax=Equid alphaherpesvirus 8 TaxID=39637 RepID=I1V8I7_9ALPH|nr:ORF73 gene product [Equid alphaherpesvirus 8]AFI33209.1 envelope glycoprotein I [Equid alphaherpesvirus 8]UER86524.1 envelope glycoprotein I [Equid alphaherpesvirus 8]
MAKLTELSSAAILLSLAICSTAIIYRGEHMSMYLNASSEFAVYPTDQSLVLVGHLLFLDGQRLPTTNYSGLIELIHYSYASVCYTVIQTISYESCPRVANSAFRSCLHKTSKHNHNYFRVNASVETNVLLNITKPQPTDSGAYILRVKLDHAPTADVFGVSAFVYDLKSKTVPDTVATTQTVKPTTSYVATPTYNYTNDVITKTESTSTSTQQTMAFTQTPSATWGTQLTTKRSTNETVVIGHEALLCHWFQPSMRVPTLYLHLLGRTGNLPEDVLLVEDSEILRAPSPEPRPSTSPEYDDEFKQTNSTSLKARNKIVAMVVIPTACVLMLLLVVVGAIINGAVRKHLLSCASRRIYRSGQGGTSAAERRRLTCGPTLAASSESLADDTTSSPPTPKPLKKTKLETDPLMEQMHRKLEAIKEES